MGTSFAYGVVAVAAILGSEMRTQTIELPSALVCVIEQVDVPAQEAGVLASVHVREGQMVERGEALAQIVDAEPRIAMERAEIEVAMAQEALANDVDIRFAKKAVEVAKAELQRSMDSIKAYPKSISDSEMDRLRLVVEKSAVEVEQAEYEAEMAEFTLQIKENDHRSAAEKVERRRILSPIGGVVVDVQHHCGEWVEPGETVVRVLRIDRLRVEGFLESRYAWSKLEQAGVELTVDLPDESGVIFPGKIVFVSPEIDPVNGQIRVWAEIENQRLKLRPGMRATLLIELPDLESSAQE